VNLRRQANTLSPFEIYWFELLKCGAFECFALICMMKFSQITRAKLSSESCHLDQKEKEYLTVLPLFLSGAAMRAWLCRAQLQVRIHRPEIDKRACAFCLFLT